MMEKAISFLLCATLLISYTTQGQQREIHPNWGPIVKKLRADDITTTMAYRAELGGNLTHRPHPNADPLEDVAVYGFSSEKDIMTWTVEAPEDDEYKIALIYCGSKEILSECTLEVKSGETIINEKTNVPTWEQKPYYQRHYLKESLRLKKGINKISLKLVNLPEAQIAAANNSFERKEPYRQRDHVTKHGFCMWSIELFRPESYTAIRNRAREMKPDLNWMTEGKYGIFVHFSPISYASNGETLLKDQYQAMVNLFNVEAFADTIAETGASWVCFTTTHVAQYWPGPNKTLDRILPGRTCERDLIRELIDELGKHDIRLMLYYGVNWKDSAWTLTAGMHEPNSTRYVDNVESLFREISLRYGEDLVSTAGYFDGAGWTAYQFDPPWEKWNNAIKAGNPNAPAGFSQNWGPGVSLFSDLQMTDGRGNRPAPAPEWMFRKEGQYDGLQPAFWGHIDEWIRFEPYHGTFPDDPVYTTQEYIELFRIMDEANIPVTMNMLITSDVTSERLFFNPKCVEIMREVRKAIKGEEN